MNNMLEVLPDGEYKIIKKTKYGIWVLIGTAKVFMNYSDTFYPTLENGLLDIKDTLQSE